MESYRVICGDWVLREGELHEGEGVAIGVASGRIMGVGPAEGLEGPSCEEVVRLPGRALLPGGVNVHSHAFQILLRGRADNAPSFRRWVDDHMYALVRGLDAEDLESAMLLAFCEMALHGITAVGEFYYLHNRAGTYERLGTAYDELAIRAARRAGLRIAHVRALYDVEGPEGRERFRETVDEAIAHTRALHAAWREDPFVTVVPAAHSLHGASAAMVQAAHGLAVELNAPMHIHLAEQEGDLEVSRRLYGKTPLRALEELGVLDRRLVCVHGVWLDAEEWRMLGAAGGGLAYNPSANMFLGDGVTDIEAAARAGVTIGLGCDGPGGNNRLDLFGEMRAAELLQRVTKRRMGVLTDALPGDPCPPFTMGTRGSARLLGLEAGAIVPVMRGDLVAIDLDDPTLQPHGGPDARVLLNNLVYAGSIRSALTDVFVGGRDVVRDRRLVGVDPDELRERAARLNAGAAGRL